MLYSFKTQKKPTWSNNCSTAINNNRGMKEIKKTWFPVVLIIYLVLSQTAPLFAVESITAKKLNREALSLFQQGKIIASISKWEKIPDTERTAEILNNLGYAYFKRSRQYFDGCYGNNTFLHDDYFKARDYLAASQKKDASRWTVYLNSGDFYFHYGLFSSAKESYETLLRLHPKYAYAGKIRDKIKLINRELEAEKTNSAPDINGFKSYIVEINPSLPLYVLHFKKKDGWFDGIDVLKGDSLNIIQSLDCDAGEAHSIFTADFNIDGYYDVAVIDYTGSGRNYGYCYWLFDKDSKKFKRQEKPELVCPYVDYEKKTLRTQWSGSDHHSTSYYTLRKDKWILASEIEVKYHATSTNGYRKILRKQIKGAMVTVSDRIFEDNEEAFSHIRKQVEH
jgi:tetratricopeptide (TPR) repeat protein